MDYEFDPAKDEANFEAHGLRLSDFAGFDVEATVAEDERVDYGEVRFRAFGRIDGKGYCLVYTARGGSEADQLPSRTREGDASL